MDDSRTVSPASRTSGSGAPGRSALTGAAGIGFLLLYAAPLLFPPTGLRPAPPAADAWLIERVFPGVPAWWIVARLGCLVAGAALVCRSAHRLVVPCVPAPAPRREGLAPRMLRIALILAAVHAASSVLAPAFNRVAETVYLLALAAPALLLAAAEPHRVATVVGKGFARASVALPLALVWVGWQVATAWHSPRAADAVDAWQGYQRLLEVAGGRHGLLAESYIPGFTNAYMIVQGVHLLSQRALGQSFAILQAVHCLWVALTSLGVALLASVTLGRSAAVVAGAAFLFSPFTLSLTYDALPVFLGPLFTVVLLLLYLAVDLRGSAVAVIAFGAAAGFAIRIPQLTLVTLLTGTGVAWSLWRRPIRPAAALAVSALSFLAAVLPGLPDLDTVRGMISAYTTGKGQWAGLEAVLMGQRSPADVLGHLWTAGNPGALDVALGGLLSPFTIARTPLRLWGDTLFDPIGAALSAAGILACVARARSHRGARLLLLLLVSGLLPGLFSSYDRPSHTRLAVMPVPLALLAAIGFETVRQALPAARRNAAATVLAAGLITAGGVVVFDLVNPRILPASSIHLALRALGEVHPAGRGALLEHSRPFDFDWLHERLIVEHLPARPFEVSPYPRDLALEGSEEPMAEVVFWSPALEIDENVSADFCRRWPDTALYEITDVPRIYRVFGARPLGPGWEPSLPRDRWRLIRCADRARLVSSAKGREEASGRGE